MSPSDWLSLQNCTALDNLYKQWIGDKAMATISEPKMKADLNLTARIIQRWMFASSIAAVGFVISSFFYLQSGAISIEQFQFTSSKFLVLSITFTVPLCLAHTFFRGLIIPCSIEPIREAVESFRQGNRVGATIPMVFVVAIWVTMAFMFVKITMIMWQPVPLILSAATVDTLHSALMPMHH